MKQQMGIRKTFTGETKALALVALKRELGAEAFIIEERKVRVGGVLGFGSREVFEVTGEVLPEFMRRRRDAARQETPVARDLQDMSQMARQLIDVHRANMGRPVRGGAGLPTPDNGLIARTVPGAAFRGRAYEAIGGAARRTRPAVVRDPRFSQETVVPAPAPGRPAGYAAGAGHPAPIAAPRPAPPAATHAPVASDPEIAQMRSDVEQMRQMMTAIMGHLQPAALPAGIPAHQPTGDRAGLPPAPVTAESAPAEAGAAHGTRTVAGTAADGAPAEHRRAVLRTATLPPLLAQWHERLIDAGVDGELTDRLIASVAHRTAVHERDDAALHRSRLAKEIAGMLRIATAPEPHDDRPLVVVVVGATGVGKTTTLAKLGAIFKREENRTIAYITLDDFRIAAAEQLRTYSDILQAPFEAVSSPEELSNALDKFYDREVILIDTAGRSPYDTPAIAKLRETLDSMQLEPEVFLLVSASTQVQEMEAVLKSFAVADRMRLCFTKVDETVRWGPIYGLAVRSGIPVAYCTTGQNVPDDIEPALRARFVDALLGPEAPVESPRPAFGDEEFPVAHRMRPSAEAGPLELR